MMNFSDWDEALGKIGAEYIEKCARSVADKARELCPKNEKELRGSIYFECEGLHAEIGTDSERAAAVEMGTRKSVPNPFLTRALQGVV